MTGQSRQKLLLGILIVGGLGYLGYQYAYAPRAAEIAELESRLNTLEIANRTARILSERGGEGDVEEELARYNERLERVEALIPSSEELPDLLDAISTEAQRTGVELTLIQPRGATAEEFYTRRTYDMAVLGSYHEIGAFLTRVGSLPRIVTPIELTLTVQEEEGQDGNPVLEAQFAIETYVLPNIPPVDAESEADQQT